jgi:glycosyltransferase involved in cell wall biosynthesis
VSAAPSAPLSAVDRLRVAKRIWHYHAEIAAKRLAGPFLPRLPLPAGPAPSVTVLVTNSNNRDPLELTLRTALAHTAYPRFEVVVADNDSTDGSAERVEALARSHPIRLVRGPARDQPLWYDHFLATVETDYWVGIHEDLLFLTGDWLGDLVAFMEAHPRVDLLGGEYFPPVDAAAEPVSGAIVDMRESLSTWVFCVRSSLRERIDTSFVFYRYRDEERGRTVVYDQGGKLIADMRAAGLGFACMPPWYVRKWQHLANLTWAFKLGMPPVVSAYKHYQLRDATRRLRKLQRRELPLLQAS